MPPDLGLELSLFAGCLCATAGLVWWLWRLNRAIGDGAAQLTRTAAIRAEALRMREANERLAEWQQITESSVAGGTQAVRAVHKGIAAIPFSILEAIPVTRDTTRVVRAVHDLTSDRVYAAISTVNRLLGETSRHAIGDAAKKPPLTRPLSDQSSD